MKAGLAQMAKGGIIMDVTTAEQAKIAENAGVCVTLTKPFQSLLNPAGTCKHFQGFGWRSLFVGFKLRMFTGTDMNCLFHKLHL